MKIPTFKMGISNHFTFVGLTHHDNDRLGLDLLCPGGVPQRVGGLGQVRLGRRNAGNLEGIKRTLFMTISLLFTAGCLAPLHKLSVVCWP